MKRNSCSYKPRYEEYLKLIYTYLLDDMCTELAHMKIPDAKITCAHRKAHMMIVLLWFDTTTCYPNQA
jgi:hypothetical protein